MVNAEVKSKVQGLIDDNAVMVFSKSYCPYCKQAKNLLSSKGAKYNVIELDDVADGSAMQDALQEISSQRTVPNIYIQQQHIGGNSDLQSLGDLDDLLKKAGAL